MGICAAGTEAGCPDSGTIGAARTAATDFPNVRVFEIDSTGDKPKGPPTVALAGFTGIDHDHGVHAGVFGPDGRFYVTMRQRRTILGISATLDGDAEPLLPEGIVPFPRGFGFGRDGSLYLASGIGPSGEGDNTILVFDPDAPAQPRRLVIDPELSPLDLTVVPNGHIVVASEFPFRAPDAVVTVREYDPASGDLVRVFAPEGSVNFRQPRGLRLGPDGHLYCVGEAHAIAFDFSTGDFLGPVLRLPRLHGQALVLLE